MAVLSIASLFLTTSSCKKDDDVGCGGLGWAVAVSDESQDWIEASNAWAANPDDKDLCEAYLAAYEDYLNALRDYDDCVLAVNRNEWQDTIDDAIEEIDNTECD